MLKICGLVFMLSKSWRPRKVDSGCRRWSPWKHPQEHMVHVPVAECLLLARLSERSPLLRQEAWSFSCLFPSSALGKKRKTNLDTTIFRESTKTLFGPQISFSSFLLLSVHLVSLKHGEHVWPHFLHCASTLHIREYVADKIPLREFRNRDYRDWFRLIHSFYLCLLSGH